MELYDKDLSIIENIMTCVFCYCSTSCLGGNLDVYCYVKTFKHNILRSPRDYWRGGGGALKRLLKVKVFKKRATTRHQVLKKDSSNLVNSLFKVHFLTSD